MESTPLSPRPNSVDFPPEKGAPLPNQEDLGTSSWKRQKPRPRSSAALTWFLLLVLIFLVLTLAFMRDEPMPWEDDLIRPVYLDQPQDMSAPVRMKLILQTARRIDLDALPDGPAWTLSTPVLSQLVEDNAAILDNFRDLLEEKEQEWQSRSYLWKIEDFGDDPAWQAVILMKQVEAAYLARRGQEHAAFLAAADMAVLARILERMDAWPSFMDRALELHTGAAQSTAELLRTTKLSEPVLRQIQEAEYEPWAPSVENMREAMNGFYSFERKLLLGPEGGEPPLPAGYIPARAGWLFFKPNATLRLMADSFRELKDIATLPNHTATNQVTNRLNHRMASGRSITNPNSEGVDYFSSRIRLYTPLPDRMRLARARHALVTTLFAVRRYVVGEAQIPQTLDDLVTKKYLPALPIDPFSGSPLQYRADGGWIYSIGDDFTDEGGHPTEIPLDDDHEPTVVTGIPTAQISQ